MNNLFWSEINKRFKTIMIMTFIVGFMVFISMLFYKSIADNFIVLEGFLSTGLMDGILVAFNVDIFAMKSIVGFFSSYCTMWVMMAGSIFFAYFGADLISREEKNKTIEYLISKPYSRGQIYVVKWLALQIFTIFFIFVIALVGLAGVEVEKKYASYQSDIEKLSPMLEDDILKNSKELSKSFVVSEDVFNRFITEMLSNQLITNFESIEDAGIDIESILALIGDDINDPENLFKKMIQSPEVYLPYLQPQNNDNSNDSKSEAEFVAAVEEESKRYKDLKRSFMGSKDPVGEFFMMSPKFFIDYFIDENKIEAADSILSGALSDQKVIYKYKIETYVFLLINMFVVVSTMGSIGFVLAAVLKNSSNSPQIALVLGLAFYFMNSVSELTKGTAWIKWLSPYGFATTNVQKLDLNGLNDPKLLILCLVQVVIVLVGKKIYDQRSFIL